MNYVIPRNTYFILSEVISKLLYTSHATPRKKHFLRTEGISQSILQSKV